MAEILKERSELDPQFQWDLTPMFESDAAWETALENLDAEIDSVAAFAGKLSDAITIGAYLDATTELNRKVEQLYCYASMRHDEDTRGEAAQSMYARINSKYVKLITALSFAQPEILALPEETLLQEATRWEMRHGGVSGRTAQQFINYLAGTQTAGETP